MTGTAADVMLDITSAQVAFTCVRPGESLLDQTKNGTTTAQS